MAREAILSLVQNRIHGLAEEGANPILLLCTGEFPELTSDGLLIEPDRLLINIICGLGATRIGVFVPLASQFEALADKWQGLDMQASFVAASPYLGGDGVRHAAERLMGKPIDLVIMDCVGYTRRHRDQVRQLIKVPVVLSSSMVARVVGELLAWD